MTQSGGGTGIDPSGWRRLAGRDTLLVLLSSAGACVDAVSYLGLGRVFTANMTGNTVLLGLALIQQDVPAVVRSAMALAGFVLGVAVGQVLLGHDRTGGRWPPAVTTSLTLELVLLAALMAGWYYVGPDPSGAEHQVLIVLSAGAMGLQSVAVRRLGVAGVTTTYVTGTLTTLTAEAIDWLRSPPGRGRGEGDPRSRGSERARGPGLPALVWGVYLVAVVIGGLAMLRWDAGALWLPILAVAAVIVIERIGRPGRDGEATGSEPR